jgi:hypothetical protein
MSAIDVRGKGAVFFGGLLLAGGLGGAVVGGAFDNLGNAPARPTSAAAAPAPSASATAPDVAAEKARCAALAADPNDPGRAAKPVPDGDFVPAQAIEACEVAARLDPNDPQVRFELGRSYWLARRDSEALEQFGWAAKGGYAAAAKFLGDAYYFGRGLPPREEQNFPAALDWYKKARDAGYPGAADLVETTERTIRKNTFDASVFQRGDYMTLLYENRLKDVDSPVAMAFYLQGVVSRLDDEQTVFMDPKCKPLLNYIGNFVIQNGQLLAIAKVLADGDKDKSGRPILIGALSFVAGSMFRDQGNRDGIILWDGDHYGCDSAVTKKIVSNIMVKLQDFR